MINMRLKFSKQGNARYISHLDINRVFSRAVSMSGFDVWFTEGFNTHVYLNFALALPLGTESDCELVDLRFIEKPDPDEVRERLNAVLPTGIRVLEVAEADRNFSEIAYSSYSLELFGDSVCGRLDEFFNSEEIITEKHSKKGIKKVDIKPLIAAYSFSGREPTALNLTLSSGNERNLSPNLVLTALERFSGAELELYRIRRTAILDEKFSIFA